MMRIVTDWDDGSLTDIDKWHWFTEPTGYNDKGFAVFVWGKGKPLKDLL
jgi:hypothetical protein